MAFYSEGNIYLSKQECLNKGYTVTGVYNNNDFVEEIDVIIASEIQIYDVSPTHLNFYYTEPFIQLTGVITFKIDTGGRVFNINDVIIKVYNIYSAEVTDIFVFYTKSSTHLGGTIYQISQEYTTSSNIDKQVYIDSAVYLSNIEISYLTKDANVIIDTATTPEFSEITNPPIILEWSELNPKDTFTFNFIFDVGLCVSDYILYFSNEDGIQVESPMNISPIEPVGVIQPHGLQWKTIHGTCEWEYSAVDIAGFTLELRSRLYPASAGGIVKQSIPITIKKV